MRVSLILTVLNEGDSLRRLLDSLAAQTRPPDEIVVADGGSTDETISILREYSTRLPIRILAAPDTNISQGRNAAIREATGEIIAVTDGGVRADKRWLEELVMAFEAGEHDGGGAGGEGNTSPVTRHAPHAVAGFFAAEGETPFEIAMGATVLPEAQDVNPKAYLPSSRSVAF
ncbi:MAG: glycosyltransferase, partial [Chloroflexi bacterium]|nr:glycosyltransferase [Chloroflexota bacterium]